MIIPIYDMLLLPGMNYPLTIKHIDRESLEKLVKSGEQLVALPLKHQVKSTPTTDDFYKIGAILKPGAISETRHGLQLMVKVSDFAQVTNVVKEDHGLAGEIMTVNDGLDLDEQQRKEMLSFIKELAAETGKLIKMPNTEEVMKTINDYQDINRLMGFMAQFLNLSVSEKYLLMETNSLKERALHFIDFHHRFHESMKLQVEMAEHFSEKANKNYREQALREQLRLIQEELNEVSPPDGDGKKKDYKTRVEEANLPEEVESVVMEELSKLESQNPQSSDYNVIRNYIDFILELPWSASEESSISITEARRVLNEHHYGLDKVKDRIIQHLAVMQLKKEKKRFYRIACWSSWNW